MSGIGNNFYSWDPSQGAFLSGLHSGGLNATDLADLDRCGASCAQAERAQAFNDDLALYEVAGQIQSLIPGRFEEIIQHCDTLTETGRVMDLRDRAQAILDDAQQRLGRDLKELAHLNSDIDCTNDIALLQFLCRSIQKLNLRNKLQHFNAGAYREDVAERFIAKCEAKISVIQGNPLPPPPFAPFLIPVGTTQVGLTTAQPHSSDVLDRFIDNNFPKQRLDENAEALERLRRGSELPEALISLSHQLKSSDPERAQHIHHVVFFWVKRWLDAPFTIDFLQMRSAHYQANLNSDNYRADLLTWAHQYLTAIERCEDNSAFYRHTTKILKHLDDAYADDITQLEDVCNYQTNHSILQLLGTNVPRWKHVKKPHKEATRWDENMIDIAVAKSDFLTSDSPEDRAFLYKKILEARMDQYEIARSVAEDLEVVSVDSLYI